MSGSPQLVILPPPSESGESVLHEKVILGLPLIRRTVLSAKRAGIEYVRVVTQVRTEMERVIDGTGAEVMASDEPIALAGPGRVLVLSAPVVADSGWLKALLDIRLERERLYLDGDVVAVIELERTATLSLPSGSQDSDIGLGLRFDREFESEALSADQDGRLVLSNDVDVKRVENWLLCRLIKESDSFIARHFHRRISLAISRRLATTALSPNMWTLFSLALGLMSAPFFLSSQIAHQLTGAIIFLIHAIIDGCDGELARLQFQESRSGMFLDLWGDNLVHAAVFSCIGIGWWISGPGVWPLLVTGIAVAGVLWTAWLVYRQSVRWSQSGVPSFSSVVRSRKSGISRVIDALGNRDFIYLVLLLSAFGKVHWFLVLTAVGSPIFALVLIFLARKEDGNR